MICCKTGTRLQDSETGATSSAATEAEKGRYLVQVCGRGVAIFVVVYLCPLPLLRFLVDVKWLKQWKKYVGYDQWDQYHVGQVSANPGPIDNANLFKGRHVHEW